MIAPEDNVAIALRDLETGYGIKTEGYDFGLVEPIPVKHKFALVDLKVGDTVVMYGVPVGKMTQDLAKGGLISVHNVAHTAADYQYSDVEYSYTAPDVSAWKDRVFLGYHRKDGQVGTANIWLFIPLVFCQNRNLKVLKEAFEEELGYAKANPYRARIRQAVSPNDTANNALENDIQTQVFPNVDGIRFLLHEGGCGGTDEDSENLINLLAGYIKNPNVAGATVLSLGCQKAQISMLRQSLEKGLQIDKPMGYFEQQAYASEREMMNDAVDFSLQGLAKANTIKRQPAPLSKLRIGLECGGSDGFSGLTANPLMGRVADRINALNGISILSEFPELCGVEQDLVNRCQSKEVAEKFIRIMRAYDARAKAVGSGFDMNPSPGNVKDGLITDAIKSAGAATKGGRSPVADVKDYGEYIETPGLNLLCTPGNDVESTTGLAGFGANVILFSTGLGTPTGNVVCPVIKIATNSMLPARMKDIIDFDAGRLISEKTSPDQLADELLELIINVASGTHTTCADVLGQTDFIPWKRGVSL